MSDHQDEINRLFEKQDILRKKQDELSNEIRELRHEIIQLNKNEAHPFLGKDETKVVHEFLLEDLKSIASPIKQEEHESETNAATPNESIKSPKGKSDIEKFIGENLINKIGIAITIIGVAIGAKYSIDNDLISPLSRIVLAYLAGIGLLGFGMKLKEKYESYSAVLVSGAIAILYFVTYLAYSLYELFPQALAFILMLIFTVFTVFAAINYNKQVIAHIGLVGAYAVPFLLSDGSGKVGVLFTYMTIINLGILFIAFKKYWKALQYSSFTITWLIFLSWFIGKYQGEEHLVLGTSFLIIFFGIFYLLFLAYKLVRKENFNKGNSLLLLSNSFIFYGIGYAIIAGLDFGTDFLGLFTLANAIIHSIVCFFIYKQKLADKNVFYLIAGLVLIFITITFPVQLDGNWVTLLWASEAALLFWLGRTKKVSIYEAISYPLMILAFFSLLQDWTSAYNTYLVEDPESKIAFLLNVNFLSSVLFIGSFGFINKLNSNKNYPSLFESWTKTSRILSYAIPAILIFTAYYSVLLEIDNYWNQLISDSVISIQPSGQDFPQQFKNSDLLDFKAIWILNYSLLFFSLLSVLNTQKMRNKKLAYTSIALSTLALVLFLSLGLYMLSELRDTYLSQNLSEYYHRGVFNLIIRYISLLFAALSLGTIYLQMKKLLNTKFYSIAFDALLFTSLVWILSSELINWMDISESGQSYKLGLSILWGSYSLLLIIYGIRKHKKHLRIGAISLVTITLVKLFFYDISQLSTIAKTIVFVSLGILLLIISFLYNKYKNSISEEDKNIDCN
jgi:uncharacterized membrane protein